jgi:hypothetical protein
MSKDPKDPINEVLNQVPRGPRVPNYRPFGSYNPQYGGARGMDNGILPAISAGLNVASGISSMASRFMPRPNYPSQQSAPSVAPPAPRPAAASPAGGSNPYGFAASGSDEDTAANFFAADKRMQQAQAAKPTAAPKPVAAPAPAPMPAPTPASFNKIDPETIKKNTTGMDVRDETGMLSNLRRNPETGDLYDPGTKPVAPVKDTSIPANLPAQGKEEKESGPTKGKKKMSESTLINAFLRLQATEHSNIFEAAKKAKKDWDKDGKIESGKDEYLGSKIAAAKKAGKMEEELKGDQDKIDANKNGKIDSDDFRKLRSGKKSEKMKAYRADRDKHGEMEEEVQQIDEVGNPINKQKKDAAISAIGAKNRDKHYLTRMNPNQADKIRGREVTKGKDRKWYGVRSQDHMDEDVEFSEAEIAHFEAVIARKDQKGKEKGIGDTVSSEDLTDEYINEMAQRGVKAGQKRGSYKKKATDLQGNRAAAADAAPDEGSKGVPHVLDQIRHGHEDEHGFKSITHPASSLDAPVTKKIHRSELHGFYDRYHNTEKPAAKEKEYSSFLGKHFGDERSSAPTSKSVTTDLSKVEKANLKGGGAKPTLGGSKLVGGSK